MLTIDSLDEVRLFEAILREDLSAFIEKTFYTVSPGREYLHNWHIDLIADYLTACHNGEIKRLIINIPPRTLKSISCTVAFPAWLLGKKPNTQIIAGSYSERLSTKHNMDCRLVMQSEWYKRIFPTARLVDDQNTKTKFVTAERGHRIATSVKGTATGEGADCFVAGTLVQTDKGIVAIEDIVANPANYKVLSYNLLRERIEYKKAVAGLTKDAGVLYEIRTAEGFSIKCTGNHPVWTEDSGYKAAADLRTGEKVLSAPRNPRAGIFFNKTAMQLLREQPHKADVFYKKGTESRLKRRLLQQSMLLKSSCHKKLYDKMQEMWDSYAPQSSLLQRAMQARYYEFAEKTNIPDLQALQHPVFEEMAYSSILRQKVRRQSPCVKNARQLQLKCKKQNTARDNRKRAIQQGKAFGSRKGLLSLPELRKFFKAECSSHRLRFIKSRHRQLNNALRQLPHKTSQQQILLDRIASIRKISGAEQPVYDIQVEENHNFFANGILVHNCLILDDPLNPKQALSDTERESANNWFDQTIRSRLNDKEKGIIIIVMQRLHEKDLTGYCLDEGGWEHLCLPLEAQENKIYTFYGMEKSVNKGDILHPERFTEDVVTELKRTPMVYATQYMQQPAPREGGIVDVSWFSRYQQLPEKIESIVQSWDTAFKGNAGNDPSACTTWAVTKTGYYLMNCFVKRMEYPELKRKAVELANEYSPHTILIEDKASGQSLLQELRHETNLPILAMKPVGDKIARISAVSSMIESGKVFLPEKGISWLDAYILEFGLFPNSLHDDMVDSTSQFLQWINLRKRVMIPPVKPIGITNGG